ncbi:hypothetical protein [Vibrio parahaemolyticus]|uniref:hypothetical protein n=1 Tax=Vibrio parahaemolyticus TaxID=670 RepID=UPI00193E08DB|nr:hypothetical protein [Vibrio parahaemolyticus]MBM5451413.1 hypothetical protein [Vibrio parahaemolyticus]MCF9675748.1 hypothetical protein [Vibrio parahaemolyticus]MCF9719197.1 hypothetical protein [Vibrio parahaemolyticus]MCF9802799.1 hypothetical protein [Vibrio parahaemolyticus]
MTLKCNKCSGENVEFMEYQYESEFVDLDLCCHDCSHKFNVRFINVDYRDSLKSGCVKCSSENCDSASWDTKIDEEGNVLMSVDFDCEDCGFQFERKYLED